MLKMIATKFTSPRKSNNDTRRAPVVDLRVLPDHMLRDIGVYR